MIVAVEFEIKARGLQGHGGGPEALGEAFGGTGPGFLGGGGAEEVEQLGGAAFPFVLVLHEVNQAADDGVLGDREAGDERGSHLFFGDAEGGRGGDSPGGGIVEERRIFEANFGAAVSGGTDGGAEEAEQLGVKLGEFAIERVESAAVLRGDGR